MFNPFLNNDHPQITMIDQGQSEFTILGFNHLLNFIKAKEMTKRECLQEVKIQEGKI